MIHPNLKTVQLFGVLAYKSTKNLRNNLHLQKKSNSRLERRDIQIFCHFHLVTALFLPITPHDTCINQLLRFLNDLVYFWTIVMNQSLQIYNFLYLSAYNLQVKLTKRRPTNLQLFHFESCRFYNGKHPKSTA